MNLLFIVGMWCMGYAIARIVIYLVSLFEALLNHHLTKDAEQEEEEPVIKGFHSAKVEE